MIQTLLRVFTNLVHGRTKIKIVLLFTAAILFANMHLSACNKAAGSDSFTSSDGILYREGNAVCELEGIDPVSGNMFAAAAVGDSIYTAYMAGENNGIVIKASHDNGKEFVQYKIALTEYDAISTLYLALADEQCAYLLYCSSPGLGQMTKLLFCTTDGGIEYEKIADLTDTIENYPVDFAICGASGLILTQNHGAKDYAFRSDDSGVTWYAYHLDCVQEANYNYVDGNSIILDPQNGWELKLYGVSNSGKETISLYSTDNWNTWEYE